MKLQLVLSDAPQSMLHCPVQQQPPEETVSVMKQLRPNAFLIHGLCGFTESPTQPGTPKLTETFTQNHIFASVIPAAVTSGWQDGERLVGGLQLLRKYFPIVVLLCSLRNSDGTVTRTHSQHTRTMDDCSSYSKINSVTFKSMTREL